MAKIEKNILFGTTLVRIKSEIEKKHPLVRVRAKIEKNTLFGLVRIKSEIERKTPFFVGLWLGLGQK